MFVRVQVPPGVQKRRGGGCEERRGRDKERGNAIPQHPVFLYTKSLIL